MSPLDLIPLDLQSVKWPRLTDPSSLVALLPEVQLDISLQRERTLWLTSTTTGPGRRIETAKTMRPAGVRAAYSRV